MKLYRVGAWDKEFGLVLSWHGNKREAERTKAQATKDGQKDANVDCVEIPTGKAGLVKWLNRNLRSGNDD